MNQLYGIQFREAPTVAGMFRNLKLFFFLKPVKVTDTPYSPKGEDCSFTAMFLNW